MPNKILSPFDARDYSLATIGLEVENIPEEYRNPQKAKFLMQMTSYQCVAHALATTMAYGELKMGLKPNDYSRGFPYMIEKQDRNTRDGCCTRDVLKNANKVGNVLWDDFKYGNSTCYPLWNTYQKHKEELIKKAITHKIVNYFKLNSFDDIRKCVLEKGACIFDYPVYKGTGFSKHVKVPKEGTKVVTYHSVTCIGWTKDNWILQDSYNPISRIFYLPFNYCDFSKLECWGITVTETPRLKKPNILKRIISNTCYFFHYLYLEVVRFIHFIKKVCTKNRGVS